MGASIRELGPFLFDSERMTLACEGLELSLGTKGAALFSALADANGGVVTKTDLMRAAWPGSVVEEANLTVQIAALRRTLGTWAGERDWIVTVPRSGYRLVLPPPAETTAGHGAPAVAVLPFENLSGDPAQAVFADGLVEEIITALSRFRTFAVVARSSSLVFKGRNVDVREVAKALGVLYVLEGTVRRSGDKVRVTAQLIEGTSGAHIWAEMFEGVGTDIFDFQDQITRSVIGIVEPQIRKAEIDRARRKRPDSLLAWDLYIRAMPLVYGADIAGYTVAIELLDRALALAPDYAPALAFASWAHEKRRTFGGPAASLSDIDDAAIAVSLAERALEADPHDAVAMGLLGWERILFNSDFSGLTLCTRAVEINPNHRAVLDLGAVAHLFAGSLEQTIACGMRAVELSPGAPDAYMCLNHIASACFSLRRFDEAAEWAQRSIAAERNFVFSHLFLAVSNAHLGRLDAARAAMKRVLEIRPDFTITIKSYPAMRFPERRALMIEGLRLAGMPER